MESERLARSGVVSLGGSAFAAVAALLLTSLVGNVLGAGGTGAFFQAVGIFTILTQLLRLGTNSAVVRFIAAERAFERVGVEWRVVMFATVPVAVCSGLVTLALSVFAEALAAVLAAPAERATLEALLQAMAPFVAIGALLGVFQIAARMLRGVSTFTVLQSIALPASRLAMVAWVALGVVSVETAFDAWLVPLPLWLAVSAAIIAGPFARALMRWRRAPAATRSALTFRGFWAFSAPRAVNSGLEAALEWADVLIVAALASSEVAGVYAVATRIVRAGGVVDKAMRVAVAPTTSALLAKTEHAAASALHTRVVRTMILLNWPFYLLLVSMGDGVLRIFGPEFAGGWGPLAVMAAAAMLQTAAGMLQSLLLQGGRSTWQMYNKSLVLALSLIGNALLVPIIGIWGAALTWAVVMAVDNAVAAYQVHHLLGVDLRLRPLLAPMAITVLVFGAGGVLVRWIGGGEIVTLLAGALSLGLVYGAVLWVLRRPLQIAVLWRKAPLIGRFA